MTAVTNPPIVRLRRLRLETVVGGTQLYTTTYGLAALAGAPASIARVPQAAWLAASSGTMLITHTALAGCLAFGVLVLAGLSGWMTLPALLAAMGWAALSGWTGRRSLQRAFAGGDSTWSSVGLLIGHSLGVLLASAPGALALAVVLTQVGLGRRAPMSEDLVLLVATLLVPISGMLCWAAASDAAALSDASMHRPPSVALRVLTRGDQPPVGHRGRAMARAARPLVWVGGLRDDVANRWGGLATLAAPRGSLVLSSGAMAGAAFLAWSWGAAPAVIIVPGGLLVAASQTLAIRHLLIWLESEPFPRSAPKVVAAASTAVLLVVMCAAQTTLGFLGSLTAAQDPDAALAVRDGVSTATVSILAITAVVGCVHLLPFAVLPAHRSRWCTASSLIRLHDQVARDRSQRSV